MQKLVKRVAQAERQVARRNAKQSKNSVIFAQKRVKQAQNEAASEIREGIKVARQTRKEAWELGPLAPKHDLGIGAYDAIQSQLRTDWSNQGAANPRPEIRDKRCAWAGGWEQLNLAPKDRVVILDGPDKGKIDRIKTTHPPSGTVTLESCHQAIVSNGLGSTSAQPMPLPVSSIRLVYPITNPETGITRDVVINELKAVAPKMDSPNMDFNRWHYGNKWDRLVPTLNMIIPWPETPTPEFETTPADTVREAVEHRTFYYNLLSPPMPESVLDELRNKYSKFRTRHEPWYVAKKEAEEMAKNKRSMLLKTMQTPLEELHEKQRAIKAAREEPQLTDDMLQKLGEVIAKNKAAALSDAGVSEVSSGASNDLPNVVPPSNTSPAAPGPQ